MMSSSRKPERLHSGSVLFVFAVCVWTEELNCLRCSAGPSVPGRNGTHAAFVALRNGGLMAQWRPL